MSPADLADALTREAAARGIPAPRVTREGPSGEWVRLLWQRPDREVDVYAQPAGLVWSATIYGRHESGGPVDALPERAWQALEWLA